MPRPPSTRLPATVLALGATSFLTDVASEMIFPLLPLFLTGVLGASPAFLGIVEGAADATASVFKLAAGWLADKIRRRRPLVLAGYGLAGVVRPLIAIAALPWQVLAIRLTDRVGKGIRAAPRDALIADAVPAAMAGRAFGFHRAADHAGAALGPLIASALLLAGLPLRAVFAAAALPSLLSVLPIFFARERPRPAEDPAPAAPPPPAPQATQRSSPAGLPRSFLWLVAVFFLFALGNSSDAFLLVRASELGVAPALLPLLWAALHLSKLACSWLGGHLADRLPRVRLIGLGWAVYGLVYLGLALAGSATAVWLLLAVYGLYYGLTEPVERALVRDLAPAAARGRAYGVYNFAIGIAALPAGALTGIVWARAGGPAALGLGAAIGALASLALWAWSARYRPAAASA